MVGTPSVQKMSLTAIGTPASGGRRPAVGRRAARPTGRSRAPGRAARSARGRRRTARARDTLAARAAARSSRARGRARSVSLTARAWARGSRPARRPGAPSSTRSRGQLVARLVRPQHVLELDDVGGRLDSLEVELGDLLDVVEHARQLARHALDLVLAQAKPREPRDVQDLVAIDHGRILARGRSAHGRRSSLRQARGPIEAALPPIGPMRVSGRRRAPRSASRRRPEGPSGPR